MFDLLPYYDTINPPFWQGGIWGGFGFILGYFPSVSCLVILVMSVFMPVSMVSVLYRLGGFTAAGGFLCGA